jgi:hypothetical protein
VELKLKLQWRWSGVDLKSNGGGVEVELKFKVQWR